MIDVQNHYWEYTLPTEPNWDSYGAKPTTTDAVAAMKKLLSQSPAMVPLNNGGLQLEWSEATIEISPEGEVVEDQ